MSRGMEVGNRELLEISTKIEQEGQAFYKQLATHISDLMVKNFLLQMAKDEAEHENHFKDIFDKKGGRKYGWENNSHLRELINERFKPGIFPNLDDIRNQWPGFEGIQRALEFALQAEVLAVEFYATLRKNCSDLATKCLMIELENEEKSHRDYIRKLIRDRASSARF